MKSARDILKLRSAVAILGMVIAMAVISGPMFHSHLEAASKEVSKSEQSDESEDHKSETQLSTYEAIATVLQSNFELKEILVEILTIEHNTEQKHVFLSVKQTPQKLLRVLFRWIVSPNAP